MQSSSIQNKKTSLVTTTVSQPNTINKSHVGFKPTSSSSHSITTLLSSSRLSNTSLLSTNTSSHPIATSSHTQHSVPLSNVSSAASVSSLPQTPLSDSSSATDIQIQSHTTTPHSPPAINTFAGPTIVTNSNVIEECLISTVAGSMNNNFIEDCDMMLSAAALPSWFYVSNLPVTTTCDQIMKFVGKKFNVPLPKLRCIPLIRKDVDVNELDYISFGLGVFDCLPEIILEKSSWPENIIVRLFKNHNSKNSKRRKSNTTGTF